MITQGFKGHTRGSLCHCGLPPTTAAAGSWGPSLEVMERACLPCGLSAAIQSGGRVRCSRPRAADALPCAQPLVYMSLHIFLTTATFVVAKIFWNFYYAHTAFLVIILGMSAWNGASYYFEVGLSGAGTPKAGAWSAR